VLIDYTVNTLHKGITWVIIIIIIIIIIQVTESDAL